jgi:hypothetical protein
MSQSIFRDLIWTGTEFVGISQYYYNGNADLVRSRDGVSWSRRPITTSITDSPPLASIAWTGLRFVIVGHGDGGGPAVVFHSTNGISWGTVYPAGLALTDVEWNGSQLIAVGPGEPNEQTPGIILSSPDGLSWSEQTPESGEPDYSEVHWTGSEWLLLGGDGNLSPYAAHQGTIEASADGVTWQMRTLPDDSDSLQAAASSGSVTIAVGSNGEVLRSTDRITWTRQAPTGSRKHLRCCVWTGTQYVASGDDGHVLTSPDASTWTQRSSGTFSCIDLVWAGARLIAVGGLPGVGPAVATSLDGITWNTQASSPYIYSAVAWNGTLAVAVGTGISTSTDGGTWTNRVANAGSLSSVVWTGTRFVAVGQFADIYTSTDGVTWTSKVSPLAFSNLIGLAWSGSSLVAMTGDFDDYLTSPDGLAWTKRRIPAPFQTAPRTSITWSGSAFVVTNGAQWDDDNKLDGSYPRYTDIMTSPNGIAWTGRALRGRPEILHTCIGGNRMIGVGKNGAIVTSTNTPAVSFTDANSLAMEGGAAIKVTVQMLPAQSTPVEVPFTVTGTATAGSDYSISGGPLIFTPGQTTKTITLTPLVDSITESAETVVIILGAAASDSAVLGEISVHTSAIIPPSTVSLYAASTAINEESTNPVVAAFRLSHALPVDVQLPFILSGTATNGRDYRVLPASPVLIKAGTVEASLSLQPKADALADNNETVTVTIGLLPSTVVLGSPDQLDFTLTDTDTPPSVVSHPQHRLIASGGAINLNAEISGSPAPVLRWTRGKSAVSTGADYVEIAVAAHSQAGAYKLTGTNGSGSATTDAGEVAVVDTSDRSLGLAAGSIATISVTSAGTAGTLSYQWRRNSGIVTNSVAPDTRITGATTSKLVIKNLSSATDDGAYTCLVTQTINGVVKNTLLSGTTTLGVVADKPVFGSVDLPAGIVLGTYSYRVPYASALATTPTTFKATGLPKGIAINSVSGLISGRTTVALPAPGNDVVISMTNAKGTTVFTDKLIIAPLPAGVVGTFHGLLPRHPDWNENVGSRIELTVSSVGVATGKITTGTKAYPFKGTLRTSVAAANVPNLTTEVIMGPLGDPELSIVFDAMTRGFSAALSEAGVASTLEFSGWQNTWNATTNKASAYKTLHTFALEQGDPDMALPQGFGYGSFAPHENTGVANVVGSLADGSVFAGSTFIGPQGQLRLHQSLYRGRGGVAGVLKVAAGTTPSSNVITSSATSPVSWFKPAMEDAVKDVVYRQGIFVFDPITDEPAALTLGAIGAAYTPPLPGARVMGLPAVANNSKLDFAFGGLGDPGTDPTEQQFSVFVTVSNPSATGTTNKAIVEADDHAVTMPVLDTKTGTFSGVFTEPYSGGNVKFDRKSTYKGLLVKTATGTLGYGFFLLQEQDYPATPASEKLSGMILFGP